MTQKIIQEAIADLKQFATAFKQEKKHWNKVVDDSKFYFGDDYNLDGMLSLAIEEREFKVLRKNTATMLSLTKCMIADLSKIVAPPAAVADSPAVAYIEVYGALHGVTRVESATGTYVDRSVAGRYRFWVHYIDADGGNDLIGTYRSHDEALAIAEAKAFEIGAYGKELPILDHVAGMAEPSFAKRRAEFFEGLAA